MPPIADGKSVSLRQWLGVMSLVLGTFVIVTTEFLPIGLLGPMANDIGVSGGTAGLMVTIPCIVAAAAAPVITSMAGNIDRRHLLIGFATLGVLANIIVAFAATFEMVLTGRLLLGIAVGGFWTFAVAVGRRLVPERLGGQATALILAGVSLGAVVGVPVGTMIGSLAGWRVAFGTVATFACFVVVAQLLFLPNLRASKTVSVRDIKDYLRIPTVGTGFSTLHQSGSK